MDSIGIYIVKEDNRSAFWKYEFVADTKVRYRFGRLGLGEGSLSEPVVKDYFSSNRRDREVAKKVAEKIGKGYKQVTLEDYNREQGIATTIGSRYKIQRMEFVESTSNGSFQFGNNWDPERGVVVQILNSWTNDSYYLYLTKTSSNTLAGAAMSGKAVKFQSMGDYPDPNWVTAVRKLLKETAQAVTKIITEQFGMTGRVLDLFGSDDTENTEVKQAIVKSQSSSGSGIGEQVLFKFASLGDRVLEL